MEAPVVFEVVFAELRAVPDGSDDGYGHYVFGAGSS
jgi:hypothetical protein